MPGCLLTTQLGNKVSMVSCNSVAEVTNLRQQGQAI